METDPTKAYNQDDPWPNCPKHFVAFHNVDLLRREYEPPKGGGVFSFFTHKKRAFAEKTLGGVIWAITGRNDANGKKDYRLAAVYQPSHVRSDGDRVLIVGREGLGFDPPIELNPISWFAELWKEQWHFSFGLNQIKSKKVITGLLKLFLENRQTQFTKAFQRIGPKLTSKQMEMLRAHYNMPGRKITARQLAAAVDYPNYESANLHYGKVGSMLAEILGREPYSDALHILAEFIPPGLESNQEWVWQMRDAAAMALEELGWVSLTETSLPAAEGEVLPGRMENTTNRILRDAAAATDLKKLYHFRCQVCGLQIQVSPGKFYIEVHHVRPLGGEHKGNDNHSNMLVLCPNHHAMFDLWMPQFVNASRILIEGGEIPIKSKHDLSLDVVAYYNRFRRRGQGRQNF